MKAVFRSPEVDKVSKEHDRWWTASMPGPCPTLWASDYPPEPFMIGLVPDGPNEGHCVTREEVDNLLDENYALRARDENGIPTPGTLR